MSFDVLELFETFSPFFLNVFYVMKDIFNVSRLPFPNAFNLDKAKDLTSSKGQILPLKNNKGIYPFRVVYLSRLWCLE